MTEPNFANRTVWTGDNLDILRGINSECVDLIYLDPPFNSNQEHGAPIGSEAAGAAFKDTWTLDDVDEAWVDEIEERNPAMHSVIGAAGSAHGDSMKSYLIMMGARLLELKRILKPIGAIYLHCDDTAASWLRALMDAVFGAGAFRNEVVWKRISNHNDAGRFGRVNERLLFYGSGIRRESVKVPLSDENVKSKYRHTDERGKYRTGDITASGVRYGESAEAWNGWNPTDIGRHWGVPRKGAYAKWIEENLLPGYCDVESPLERLDLLASVGLIVFTTKGTPELKRYLDASSGQVPPDVWTDILPVNSQAKERTGYPTQKPLALLERIIKASSDIGDVVLDPFCGCATTLVAAETLGREWAGIDLSPLAVKLVNHRLRDQHGLFGQIVERTDIPRRTDLGDEVVIKEYKGTLYGDQRGYCNGCGIHFQYRNLQVDHIVPRVKEGTNHAENLQLLCGACNGMKGTGTQSELMAKLKQRGIVT